MTSAATTKQMPPEKPDQGYELRVDLSDHIDSAAAMSDIEFIRNVGKYPFIVTRKSDSYRYLAAATGADRAEARAAVLAEYPEEEFDVTDA